MPVQIGIKMTAKKFPHHRDHCIARDNQESDMAIFLADYQLGLACLTSK